MNRHMRLENRRVVSAREIVDYFLKKAPGRLGGNKPESDDYSCAHARLTPLLQFNDVAFGISHIDNAKETDAIYFC
jgi:hypothetical protein